MDFNDRVVEQTIYNFVTAGVVLSVIVLLVILVSKRKK